MPKAIYLYTKLPFDQLESLVEAHKENFEHLLEETFDEDELINFESKLDQIAAIYAQPILSELTFDDFYPNEEEEKEQRSFFGDCQSSVLLDNVPDFESNLFQISYLKILLESFPEVLIDTGGMSELKFKKDFLQELGGHKDMHALSGTYEKPNFSVRHSQGPIDFLVQDVYKEIFRLKQIDKMQIVAEELLVLSDKVKKIFSIMRDDELDADSILKKSSLIPKDFGDSLERLKFFLRRIQ